MFQYFPMSKRPNKGTIVIFISFKLIKLPIWDKKNKMQQLLLRHHSTLGFSVTNALLMSNYVIISWILTKFERVMSRYILK